MIRKIISRLVQMEQIPYMRDDANTGARYSWTQQRRYVLLGLDCGHTQERRCSEAPPSRKTMKCNTCAMAKGNV